MILNSIDRDYKDAFKRSLFWALIELIIGIALFFIPIEKAKDVFVIIFGVFVILNSILKIGLYHNVRNTYGTIMLVSSIVYLVFGVMMLFSPSATLNIIIAVFLIAIPVLRIVLNKFNLESLKSEALTIILGVVLLLFGIEQIAFVLRYIAGSVVCLLAVINLVLAYLEYRKCRNLDNVIDVKVKELD